MTQTPKTTASSMRTKAADVAQDVKSNAQEAATQAAEHVKGQAEQARIGAADEMSSVASSLRKAADDMRGGSPQERTVGQLAHSLADMSDTLRDKDLGEMAADVSAFARRNPLMFLGGAALVGFAAMRFGKASDRTTIGGTQV